MRIYHVFIVETIQVTWILILVPFIFFSTRQLINCIFGIQWYLLVVRQMTHFRKNGLAQKNILETTYYYTHSLHIALLIMSFIGWPLPFIMITVHFNISTPYIQTTGGVVYEIYCLIPPVGMIFHMKAKIRAYGKWNNKNRFKKLPLCSVLHPINNRFLLNLKTQI